MSSRKSVISGLFRHPGSSVYKLVSDLPSAKAIRKLEADFITNILEYSGGAREIVSIGTGRGELYRILLQKYFISRKLRLLGTETEDYLAAVARDEFPGDYMDAIAFRAVESGYSSIMPADTLTIPELPPQSADFIEISFMLNTFLLGSDIIAFLKGLSKILKKGGTLILADIDCCMGSYLESKLNVFSSFFKEMVVDATRGHITGIKYKRHTIPFMDLNSSMLDLEIFSDIFKRNIQGFSSEIESSQLPEAKELGDKEIELYKNGLKFYRTYGEWHLLVAEAFGHDSEIRIYTPEDIKRQFPQVKDYPFVLFAVKR